MRYGIISDVHGNLEALDVVLEHLAQQKITQYVFLGDAVGYGPNPDEVVTRLRALGGVAVLGNHDAAVTGRMDTEGFYPAARASLAWTQSQLSQANLSWLAGLPYTAQAPDILFCHGAPARPEAFDYLTQPAQVEAMLAGPVTLRSLTFMGHSHLTVSFEVQGGEVRALQQPVILCAPEAQYIITVGSVGQPRDRDPRACCAVFDDATRQLTYHRLDYDMRQTRQKIVDAGLSTLFGDRLSVGI